jgi:hypothetical protein
MPGARPALCGFAVGDAMANDRVKRLLERYRTLGGAPELELFQTLYRCLVLDARLKTRERRDSTRD